MTEALTQLFDDIAIHWGAYLAALVALSGLTMSLIQVGKELFFLRFHYHHMQTVRWLYNLTRKEARSMIGKKISSNADGKAGPFPDPELEDELLRITSAGNAVALYDAELENICVQLSAATQFLVDYPSQSKALLRAIARNADDDDLNLIVEADDPDDPSALDPVRRQRVFDARNRVRALTHRSVESFKLLTASEWRRGLQLASFIISVLIAGLALVMTAALLERPLTVVATALIAGFLAPVARDLLAAMQQLRRP